MKKYIIPIGMALALAGSSQAAFNPVPLAPSSFNYDILVENTGPTPVIPGGATTASVDQGTGNGGDTWNEQGYFLQDLNVGLPPAGTTFNAQWDPKHTYTLAPSYTANNAIMLDTAPFTNANWKLTTPAAYKALSFLTSGGNGGAQFRYTVQHQDGTSEVGVTNSVDWFFVDNNIAWVANGRVNAQDYVLDNYNSGNPRLYSVDVALSGSSSAVTNIFIERTGGNASGHSCIMAISGTPAGGTAGTFTPIPGSGYTADIVVEATAPRRWNDPYTAPGVAAPVTATMDGGTNLDGTSFRYLGATWFAQGYYARSNTFGLPAPGSTFTSMSNAAFNFTMPASYAANDGVMLDNSNTTATLTLTAPAAYTALSLLGSSGGGACNIRIIVNHADSSTETFNSALPDWYNSQPDSAWVSNGRINVESGLFQDLNNRNPRLNAINFALGNSTSPVTSLAFTYTSGGRGVIFALSASTDPVIPLFGTHPQAVSVVAGAPAALSATVSGTQPITLQWQKGTNGVYVDVTGAVASTLSIASTVDADEADYRLVASNAAGSATSQPATLTVLSTLPAITKPSDPIVAYQPNGGSSPDGERVNFAIDGTTQKYLNFGNGAAPVPPVGFVVTPTAGRTFLKVIRFYTANDAPERDPANYIVEGSNDNGSSWTLIVSNIMTLPDGRNAAGNPINSATNNLRQVRLVNEASYGAYRVYFTALKGTPALMQIAEVEMLGSLDSAGYPIITTPPTNTMVYVNGSASLYVAATGTPVPTFQWLKNGQVLPGETGPQLNFESAQFSDVADYRVVVANSLQSITSAPARLTVISTLTDITQPGDPTTSFGDGSGAFWKPGCGGGNTFDATDPSGAIDNSFIKYQNGGHGFSAAAGFAPFEGPVGFTVTPAFGSSLVTGIRVYTSEANAERDPIDVELFGSNDGGTTWTPIMNSALNLPPARNPVANAFGPFDLGGAPNAMVEVLFGNDRAYTSYKVQFTHVTSDGTVNSLQIGEVELLGGQGVPLSFQRLTGGQLQLQWGQGILLEAPNITGPWTTNTASSPLTITPTGPQKFYRLLVQ